MKTGCCGLDPTTGRGKQIHLLQILLLPFIPILALIIQNSINMVTVLEYQYDMQETIDQVRTQSSSLEHGEFRQGETEGPLKTYVYFLLVYYAYAAIIVRDRYLGKSFLYSTRRGELPAVLLHD